jgi:hypothetical protein
MESKIKDDGIHGQQQTSGQAVLLLLWSRHGDTVMRSPASAFFIFDANSKRIEDGLAGPGRKTSEIFQKIEVRQKSNWVRTSVRPRGD